MNAVLIYNPHSRRLRKQPDYLSAIHRLFRARGIQAEYWPTKHPGHATQLARQAVSDERPLVIAGGGDGTIHEVINGLAETNTPLAILPAGTANVLAKELSIPLDLSKALHRIVDGTPTRIALGRLGSQYFHSMAGVGLDASVVRSVNPVLKGHFGIGGYWLEGLKHLYTYRMPTFDIYVNGRHFQATWAVVSHTKRYGGGFRITPFADLRNGMLDVCIFKTRSKLRYLMYVPLAYFGRHVRDADIVYYKAQNVYVTGDPSIGIQADGEWVGTLPGEIAVVPQALTVII